nr:unnamed protein product [Digitaria exilis]
MQPPPDTCPGHSDLPRYDGRRPFHGARGRAARDRGALQETKARLAPELTYASDGATRSHSRSISSLFHVLPKTERRATAYRLAVPSAPRKETADVPLWKPWLAGRWVPTRSFAITSPRRPWMDPFRSMERRTSRADVDGAVAWRPVAIRLGCAVPCTAAQAVLLLIGNRHRPSRSFVAADMTCRYICRFLRPAASLGCGLATWSTIYRNARAGAVALPRHLIIGDDGMQRELTLLTWPGGNIPQPDLRIRHARRPIILPQRAGSRGPSLFAGYRRRSPFIKGIASEQARNVLSLNTTRHLPRLLEIPAKLVAAGDRTRTERMDSATKNALEWNIANLYKVEAAEEGLLLGADAEYTASQAHRPTPAPTTQPSNPTPATRAKLGFPP